MSWCGGRRDSHASVDVIDLQQSESRLAGPVRRGVRRRGQRGPAVRSGSPLPGGHARAARAKTKTRHEVAGSGKKLWKQKGTGRARMGSIRSPLWRHGGTTHGPQPRDYSYKLPRKMQLGALRSALSAKLRDGELKVVRAFDAGRPQDQELVSALTLEISKVCWRCSEDGAAGRTTDEITATSTLSARNLRRREDGADAAT